MWTASVLWLRRGHKLQGLHRIVWRSVGTANPECTGCPQKVRWKCFFWGNNEMYIHSFDRDMNVGLQKTPLYILLCIVIIFIFLLNRSFVFLLAEDKQKNLQLPGSRLQNRPDLDWPNPQLYLITHGLTRSISADRCVGWTWINYHTSAPITSLSLSVCSCCWESSGAVVIHVHPHDTSLSIDWDFCLLMEKWMILV